MTKVQKALIFSFIVLLAIVVIEIGYFYSFGKKPQVIPVETKQVNNNFYLRGQLLNKVDMLPSLYVLGYLAQNKNTVVASSSLVTLVEGKIISVNVAPGTDVYEKAQNMKVNIPYKLKFTIENTATKEKLNAFYQNKDMQYLQAKQGSEEGKIIDINSLKVGDNISLTEKYDLKNGRTDALIIKKN